MNNCSQKRSRVILLHKILRLFNKIENVTLGESIENKLFGIFELNPSPCSSIYLFESDIKNPKGYYSYRVQASTSRKLTGTIELIGIIWASV